MKQILSLSPARRAATPLAGRRQLLAEFERSGLSAAAFARQHGIGYTTFNAWRTRHSAKTGPAFAEIELALPASSEPIIVELGRQARMRLSSHDQVGLAAALLKELEASC